ncbi:MAG TPA: tetratricopeptide repeat protein [Desulfohalobiaceae bacterium]|nr:tetratricopeptide repeat protein [Desulfohalobiaceae bacterium]
MFKKGPKVQSFTRRDLIFGILNRFQKRDTPRDRTGFSPEAREIDHLIQKKDFQKAIPLLRTLLQKSPDHLQAKQKLGYCLLQQKDYETSLQVFEEILKDREQDNFSLLYYGLALAKLGKKNEAVETWKKYFNIDQPYIQRAINIQIALYETDGPGSLDDMVESIEQAIADQEREDW